jgi:hypothetical protein
MPKKYVFSAAFSSKHILLEERMPANDLTTKYYIAALNLEAQRN